jgi:hypothetical protein
MAVITLSRELGSLGTEIADEFSLRLGCFKLDKESLEVLLSKLGMAEPRLDGDEEKRPGFWGQFTLEKARYLDFMRAAMYRVACEKDCIIVGRGANIIFRGVPGILRLRITAPLKVRVARLRERLGMDEQHALRLIHQSDRDRAGYHKYFFNAIWDSSADYDVIINTAEISPAETCDVVVALLGSPTYVGASGAARDVLRDMRIAQDVIIEVVYRERIAVGAFDVVCDKGIVALDGTVQSQGALDSCVGIASRVEGVVRVVSTISIVDYAYPYAGYVP